MPTVFITLFSGNARAHPRTKHPLRLLRHSQVPPACLGPSLPPSLLLTMVSAAACGNFALAEAEITALSGKRVLGVPPRPRPWHGAGARGEEEEGCLSLKPL